MNGTNGTKIHIHTSTQMPCTETRQRFIAPAPRIQRLGGDSMAFIRDTQSRANHGPRIVRHINSGERCPHSSTLAKESNDFISLVRLISIEAINTITNLVAQLYLAAIEFLIVSGFIRVSASAQRTKTKTFFVPGRWLRHKNNCARL